MFPISRIWLPNLCNFFSFHEQTFGPSNELASHSVNACESKGKRKSQFLPLCLYSDQKFLSRTQSHDRVTSQSKVNGGVLALSSRSHQHPLHPILLLRAHAVYIAYISFAEGREKEREKERERERERERRNIVQSFRFVLKGFHLLRQTKLSLDHSISLLSLPMFERWDLHQKQRFSYKSTRYCSLDWRESPRGLQPSMNLIDEISSFENNPSFHILGRCSSWVHKCCWTETIVALVLDHGN